MWSVGELALSLNAMCLYTYCMLFFALAGFSGRKSERPAADFGE